MSDIKIWGEATDMAGTSVARKKYFIDLQDGEKRIQFVLVVTEADGGLVAEPYVPVDYDYTDYDGWEEEEEDEDYYIAEDEEDEEDERPEDSTEYLQDLNGRNQEVLWERVQEAAAPSDAQIEAEAEAYYADESNRLYVDEDGIGPIIEP